MRYNTTFPATVLKIAAIAVLLYAASAFTSCSVFKQKNRSVIDSTSVSKQVVDSVVKVDSTKLTKVVKTISVKSDTTKSKEETRIEETETETHIDTAGRVTKVIERKRKTTSKKSIDNGIDETLINHSQIDSATLQKDISLSKTTYDSTRLEKKTVSKEKKSNPYPLTYLWLLLFILAIYWLYRRFKSF